MPDDIQPGKRKISKLNIIILVILLIALGVLIAYFLKDESVLGNCESSEDCGRYNVLYIKGEGYVCANNLEAGDSSIKTKVLMLKYACKKAVKNEPSDCSCTQNQCEIVD